MEKHHSWLVIFGVAEFLKTQISCRPFFLPGSSRYVKTSAHLGGFVFGEKAHILQREDPGMISMCIVTWFFVVPPLTSNFFNRQMNTIFHAKRFRILSN